MSKVQINLLFNSVVYFMQRIRNKSDFVVAVNSQTAQEKVGGGEGGVHGGGESGVEGGDEGELEKGDEGGLEGGDSYAS